MDSLGINPVLLIAQIISFGILFFVLKKFLYKNIQNAFEERRNAIQKTFLAQEEVEKRLVEFRKEQEEKQKANQEEVRKVLAEAKKEAQGIKAEILDQARAEKKMELDKATIRIEQDKKAAQKELLSYVKEISREIVEKTLEQKAADKKWQKTQLDKSVAALKNADR